MAAERKKLFLRSTWLSKEVRKASSDKKQICIWFVSAFQNTCWYVDPFIKHFSSHYKWFDFRLPSPLYKGMVLWKGKDIKRIVVYGLEVQSVGRLVLDRREIVGKNSNRRNDKNCKMKNQSLDPLLSPKETEHFSAFLSPLTQLLPPKESQGGHYFLDFAPLTFQCFCLCFCV